MAAAQTESRIAHFNNRLETPARSRTLAPSCPSFRLPNGMNVYGLSAKDTFMVYRDIFEDDCYRQHGVTIGDGDCILDIGANTGLFVLFVNAICKNARVFAFEPIPEIFRVLDRNVKAHDRLAAQVFNAGMSDQARLAIFTYYPRMSNASTMYPDNSPEAIRRGGRYVMEQIPTLPWPLSFMAPMLPEFLQIVIAEQIRRYYMKKQTVTCQLWTVSEFLRQHRIERVDLLKVDAEQSERPILGAIADEDWPKIRQVIVEVHEGDDATRTIVELLRRRGFRTAVEPNPALPSLSLVYGVRQTGK